MLAVLIHVGQTENIPPKGRNPIFSNGSFKFVQAYFSDPRPSDPTYEKLGFGDLVNQRYRKSVAYNSPEFDTLTYNHFKRVEGKIYEKLRQEKGYLMFLSTLYYQDKERSVLEEKGLFIVGYFAVEGVYTNFEVFSNEKLQCRFRANGQFGRKDENGHEKGADWWISGIKGRGMLFPKAVPLTETSNCHKYNNFALTKLTTVGSKPLTNSGKYRHYNWTLTCPPQNLPSLRSWIYKFSGIDIYC
jgi:hypothetical protein